jgi:hypothetical protein
MDRLRRLALLITSLAMAGVFATACDSGTDEPAAPDTPDTSTTQTAVDHSTTRPPDEIPESRIPTDLPEGIAAEIPENFPDEVPIYPGAVPARGKGAEVDGTPLAAVHLMSLDSPEQVFGFYRDKLESDGWTILDREGDAERNAIMASKGKCRVNVLAAPSDDGGSNIIVVTKC